VVDEASLVRALIEGRIKGAAADVSIRSPRFPAGILFILSKI